MKKLNSYIYLLIILGCASCDLLELKAKEETVACTEGRISAIKDAKKGECNYLILGSPIIEDWEKEFHFRRYLKQKHKIELGYTGCVIDDEVVCYKAAMDSVLKVKFGVDFINRFRKNAEELYENGESLLPKRYFSDLDAEHKTKEIELIPDTEGEFMGGEEALRKYVSDNFIMPSIAEVKAVKGMVFMQFIIEKDGSVSKVKAISPKAKQLGYGIEEECKRVINLTNRKWIPAQKKGKPVRSFWRFPFEIYN